MPLKKPLSLIRSISTAGYYVGVRIRAGKADVVMNTYPLEWQQRYATMSYRLRDPVILWGYGHTGITRWQDLAEGDQVGIFEDAARHGLPHGAVAATGPVDRRTIAGFARADRAFTAEELSELLAATQKLHQHAELDAISLREAQALRAIAAGKKYAEAAFSLEISESALKARLNSARKRLGARTTVEALRLARDRRLI